MVVVFDELASIHAHHLLSGLASFAGRIGLSLAGGAAGVPWLLLQKLKVTRILARRCSRDPG